MSDNLLLMRFRDLGGIEDAIEEHRKILNERGYVWGGWWPSARLKESLPVYGLQDAFNLSNHFLNGTAELLLLNSDRKTVTRVTVNAFQFNDDSNLVCSPESNATPAYFRDYMLPLWFRIISIGNPQTIEHFDFSNYAYVDYESFRTIDNNIYSFYDNTIIDSADSLLTQSRTLIMIRRRKAGDRRVGHNEAVLRVPLSNFTPTFSATNSNQILLLSDLHFHNNPSNFVFGDYEETRFSKVTLAQAISRLTNNCQFASFICAGDYTFQGNPDGFQKAESFLFSLINTHGIDKQNVVIVPGNHDMLFSDTPSATISYTDDPGYKHYERLFTQLYKTKQNDYFAIGRRFLLKNNLPVEIVGLNSVCLQQIAGHFSGMGFVGSEQLDIVEHEMGWDKNTDKSYAFRILVLHHHLYPVEHVQTPRPDTSYSLCLDSGAIISFIKRNHINLVIHGHKHTHQYMNITSHLGKDLTNFHLLSLGSASSGDLAQDERNSIGILDFDKHGEATIRILEISNTSQKKVHNPLFEYSFSL